MKFQNLHFLVSLYIFSCNMIFVVLIKFSKASFWQLMVATTLVLLSTKPLHVSWAASLPWIIPLPATVIIGREVVI